MLYHFNRYPLVLVSTYLCTYRRTEEFITSSEMMSAIFQSTQKAKAWATFITDDDINYHLNCSVHVAIGGHCYTTPTKMHIHLIAFDQQIYREIELIAVTLMTSSKTRAPENDR